MSFRKVVRFAIGCICAALLSGCGGQQADSFANSVYIQITGSDSLQPSTTPAPSGYRIVFVNNDGIAHTITWDSPFILSASAPAGGRAWFDLPYLVNGTVASYHLDTAGPTGSITIYIPQ